VLIVVAILGIGTGYGLTQVSSSSGKKLIPLPNVSSAEKGKNVCTTNTGFIKDTAEGTLADGGIEGEGQYHLVPSRRRQPKWSIMTSSTVDLSQFIGKKIKVWEHPLLNMQVGSWMSGKVEVL